ncbi:MAG: hypothetical protein ABII27_07745 [bacterium]
MNDKNENWEELLKKINTGLEDERNLLQEKLKQKLDEIRDFKNDLNKFKDKQLSSLKTREDRIRTLELKLEEEKRKTSDLKLKNSSLSEEVRILAMRSDQLERENLQLQHDNKLKVSQINQLRMELLPMQGLSKKGAKSSKLDKLENSLHDTKNFYKVMSQKIDKILRY